MIRGFDNKKGVDFERVHQELIAPALTEAGIDGGDTTKVIVQAGSIHKDMFRELIMADIVVADVSLHNANVFYELGIRHAVRPRSTVLIYTKIDEIPFDLMTYRYMPYDAASPAAAKDRLVQVLRDTLASEDVDSPIFELLPEFVPGARTALLSLPRTLDEDIEQAREARGAEQGSRRAPVPGTRAVPRLLPAGLRRGPEPLVLGPERPRAGQGHPRTRPPQSG